MRRAIVFAAAALVVALCATAMADIPETISYQGVLRDDDGNPVPDGNYAVTFRIYDVAVGGTALWSEPQLIPISGGIMNAHLGSVVSLTTLDFLVPYWLSIQIGHDAELTPRVAFESVPYAAHAAFADNLVGGGWEVDGDNVHHEVGNVGVGTSTPDARLDVETGRNAGARVTNEATGDTTALFVSNRLGTAAAFHACAPSISEPPVNTAIYASGRCGARAGHFYSSSAEAIYAQSGYAGGALVAETTNSGAPAAHFIGGTGIAVDSTVTTGGFAMSTGAAAGRVLTSDASGVGTWQAAAGSDADWVISGNDMYSGVTGNVGIGDSTPDGKLDVYSAASAEALYVEHAGSNLLRAVNINRTSTPSGGNDILQITVPSASPDNFQYVEFDRGGVVDFAVNGNGRIDGGGATLSGDVSAASTTEYGGYFTTSMASNAAHAVHGECTTTAAVDAVGVYGKSVPVDYHGVGGYFQGGYRGLVGYVQPTGSYSYRGVYGLVSGGTGSNYAVYGYAASGTNNYGIFGQAAGGTTNYAGYFSGNAHVTGTLTAGTKAFKIDHPLDPTGKYLQHSCVESDEMANMYTGNAVLDGRGEATVTLPDWFEALNQDFRYQLTCVGGFAPVYVAKEISGNAFQIAGGEPGMKVSWMVTGVRHDAYARAHGIEVEVVKSADERGTYMHPDAYGMPETAGVDYRAGEERPLPVSETPAPQAAPVHDPNDGE